MRKKHWKWSSHRLSYSDSTALPHGRAKRKAKDKTAAIRTARRQSWNRTSRFTIG